MHQVQFTKEARAALLAMPGNVAATIRGKIDALAADPRGRQPNCRKMAGRHQYRLRVGDWRVLYRFEDDRLVIMILAVTPRGRAYQ
jgi:mRNA interferase RelE/StbE